MNFTSEQTALGIEFGSTRIKASFIEARLAPSGAVMLTSNSDSSTFVGM